MQDLKHIKNRVIAFQKNGQTVIYVQSRNTTQTMFQWQRRLRIRSAIFGHYFTTYHSEMDFTLALAAGWSQIDC